MSAAWCCRLRVAFANASLRSACSSRAPAVWPARATAPTGKRRSQALGDRGAGVAAAVQQHGELVAAEAEDFLVRSKLSRQHARDLAQNPVARPVAGALVHPFEVVQVAEDDAQRIAGARSRRQGLLDPPLEGASVA